MPEIVVSAIAWIATHPDEIIAAGKTVVGAVQDAIDIWHRWQAGTMTEAERDAAWAAAGIDMQAVRDHWRQRHPLT